MLKFFSLAVVLLQISRGVNSDGNGTCTVEKKDNNVEIYCKNFNLDDRPLPLSSDLPPSETLYLHFEYCTGRIDEGSFPNLRGLTSMSIYESTLDKFVLPELPKLTELEIDLTKLPTLIGAWKNVKDLKSILFVKNKFQINEYDFEGLENLESFYVSEQPILLNELLLKRFKKLNSLQLLDTQIKRIPKGAFENNPDLAKIKLDSNIIYEIEDGAFDELKNLERFTILNSELQKFDINLTKNLKNLKGLGIPVRALKKLSFKQLFENCPKLDSLWFIPQDKECPEIDVFSKEIAKLNRPMTFIFTGLVGNKTSC